MRTPGGVRLQDPKVRETPNEDQLRLSAIVSSSDEAIIGKDLNGITVSSVKAADGTVIGASHIARDVTLSDRLERDARHFAAIVASSDDAIISKSLDGTVVTWNAAAERLFGYTASEIVGRSIRLIVPRDRQAEEDHVLAAVSRGETIDHFETVRQRKDGAFVPISLTVSPIRDASGDIVGASKIARDLSRTERIQADARRLAAIVDSSDDAIVGKDLNSIVTSWNAAAERISVSYTHLTLPTIYSV